MLNSAFHKGRCLHGGTRTLRCHPYNIADLSRMGFFQIKLHGASNTPLGPVRRRYKCDICSPLLRIYSSAASRLALRLRHLKACTSKTQKPRQPRQPPCPKPAKVLCLCHYNQNTHRSAFRHSTDTLSSCSLSILSNSFRVFFIHTK